MNFSQLAQLLLNAQTKIPRRNWPDAIQVPPEKVGDVFGFGGQNLFWEKVIELRKFTDTEVEKFSEQHIGSTGWEYQFRMIYIDGKFIYSQASGSRSYDSVTPNQLIIKIETEQDTQTKSVKDKFYLNDAYVHSVSYVGEDQIKMRNQRITSGEFKYGFLATFHSHPQVRIGAENPVYGFFSGQDFLALMHSNSHMLGLVGDKLWILAKTAEGQIPSGPELQELGRLEVGDPRLFMEAAGDLISRHELALYSAEFGGPQLNRIA